MTNKPTTFETTLVWHSMAECFSPAYKDVLICVEDINGYFYRIATYYPLADKNDHEGTFYSEKWACEPENIKYWAYLPVLPEVKE